MKWTSAHPTESGYYYVHFGGERGTVLATAHAYDTARGERVVSVSFDDEPYWESSEAAEYGDKYLWCRIPDAPELPQ